MIDALLAWSDLYRTVCGGKWTRVGKWGERGVWVRGDKRDGHNWTLMEDIHTTGGSFARNWKAFSQYLSGLNDKEGGEK